jgi:tetratricopeptide (TPR) repeat protein
MQLHSMLSKHPDRNAVLASPRTGQGLPSAPEARFAVAQAAFSAGKYDEATSEIKQALRLRPDWEIGALFNAQMLQQRESNAKAVEYLQGFLQTWPKAREVRANYARLLINNKQLKEARGEYQVLLDDQPGNADIAVTIGLLSLQMNEFTAAETWLKRALELKYRDPDAARFYLGQVAEETKHYDEAMKYYASVQAGEQFVPAQARYAFLLGRQNKLAEAREYLQNVRTASDEQRALLIQAEAQLLREAKNYQESYDLLNRALEKQPDNLDLLYDSAMAAEKLDRIDVVETNLRKLITLKPDHAQAYNALGYTLADRTDRLSEARGYIEKALKLSPEDPFILDSMGWVLYRLGDQKEALGFLQRAYSQRADPEIAAHIGEVMWARGQQQDAEKIWRDASRDNPDNEMPGDKSVLPALIVTVAAAEPWLQHVVPSGSCPRVSRANNTRVPLSIHCGPLCGFLLACGTSRAPPSSIRHESMRSISLAGSCSRRKPYPGRIHWHTRRVPTKSGCTRRYRPAVAHAPGRFRRPAHHRGRQGVPGQRPRAAGAQGAGLGPAAGGPAILGARPRVAGAGCRAARG